MFQNGEIGSFFRHHFDHFLKTSPLFNNLTSFSTDGTRALSVQVSVLNVNAFLVILEDKNLDDNQLFLVLFVIFFNLVVLPRNFPHKSKPCPPFETLTLLSREHGSLFSFFG